MFLPFDGTAPGGQEHQAAANPPRRGPRRQSLFIQSDSLPPPRPRDHRRDPRTRRPEASPQAARITRRKTRRPRHGKLPRPQRRRAPLLRPEAMERPRDSLRQTRHHLPRRCQPERRHHLDQKIVRHALVACVPPPDSGEGHEPRPDDHGEDRGGHRDRPRGTGRGEDRRAFTRRSFGGGLARRRDGGTP